MGENNAFDDARCAGTTRLSSSKNEFHGEEQVPVQGIIMLETNFIGKPENLPSGSIIERAAMDDKDERYIWEKRETVCYDIRRENRE